MTSTLGTLLLFLIVVGLVIAVGIAVGMIVAGRLDRILAPPGPNARAIPEPAVEPQSDPARIEEHRE